MKRALTLYFRDARTGNHSIERLFRALESHFGSIFDCSKVVLPCQPSGPRAIFRNILFARKHAKGICHITGDAQYLATFLPSGRTVLTIHDCGYLQKLTGLKKLLYKWIWFKLPCWRAARITVISEATKKVLEAEIGPLGDKLQVVENCLTSGLSRTNREFNEQKPRILQIGSGRHKNLDTLIKAVEGLECELHIVGKLSDENRRSLEEKQITYTNEFAVSDERMEAIFHSCDLLFFASRYEGFGLPILEGNVVGIPVITSNCYSMPDVAGDAAIVVDPESSKAIREAIISICNDSNLRAKLVNNGISNINRFMPETIANNYIKIYKLLN